MTTPKGALVPALSPTDRALVTWKRRSVASSSQRRRRDLMLGNSRALQHGVFAKSANAQDVAVEVALIFGGTHPGLDPLADRRLVEQLALASVQHRRALLAIEADGLTPTLTSYCVRLAQLVERLEQKVHDREKERIAHLRRGDSMIVLMQQRPKE
jgi:hypothetical protein